MLGNYLKLAIRNLRQNAFFTSLNLVGLALGLAVSAALTLYILDEWSFDRFHSQADQIYRVGLNITMEGQGQKLSNAPNITGPAAKENIPEVREQARFLKNNFGQTAFVSTGEQRFTEQHFYWADPGLFNIFDINLIAGNRETALNNPNTVILSRSVAEKYFLRENPLGKTIKVDNQLTLEVTGVYEDFPSNSTLECELIGSFKSIKWANDRLYWSNASYETYLLLAPNTDYKKVEKQIEALYHAAVAAENRWFSFYLQPLKEIHLYSADVSRTNTTRVGDARQVWMLSGLALAVLVLACVNYMNMATARSQQRFRDVGINKALGASRAQLTRRFYVETGLLAALAMALGFALLAVLLPWFNQLSEKNHRISALFQPVFIGALVLSWIVVTLFSGAYPALFLSRFSPKNILQPSRTAAVKRSWLRQALVTGQFAVSTALIIGTVVFYQQLSFMRDKKLGFQPRQTVAINTVAAEKIEQIEGLINDCKGQSDVQSVCRAQTFPGKGGSGRNISPLTQSDKSFDMTTNRVTPGFIETLGLQLVAGQDLPLKPPTDTNTYVILNESAVKVLGITPEEAVGRHINQAFEGGFVVSGVVADFHFQSLHQPISPYAFHDAKTEGRTYLLVKMNSARIESTMSRLREAFLRNLPNSAFDYTFLDQHFDTLYRSETRLSRIALIFSGLTIFISCLGLFGLAAFTAERRAKEVGVRRVLGASGASLVALLSKDFIKLVLIALAIAMPLAWWAMNKWLQNFAYRTELSWQSFALAALSVVSLALLTVGSQAAKAASADPVKSLRIE